LVQYLGCAEGSCVLVAVFLFEEVEEGASERAPVIPSCLFLKYLFENPLVGLKDFISETDEEDL